MIADFINGGYEALGSIAVWLNVASIIRDKGYAGTRLATNLFFWSWGIWNLYYYPSLNQWGSFAGGLSLSIADTVYFFLMLKYGRK